jgi:hypothetical protein
MIKSKSKDKKTDLADGDIEDFLCHSGDVEVERRLGSGRLALVRKPNSLGRDGGSSLLMDLQGEERKEGSPSAGCPIWLDA